MRWNGWVYGALPVLLGLVLLLPEDPGPPASIAHLGDSLPDISLLRAPDTGSTLQEAFIGFLSGDAGNLAAEETARFLKSHAVRLRLHDPGSTRVLAEFDSDGGNLNLNPVRTVRTGMIIGQGPVDDDTSRNLEATIASVPGLLKEYVDNASRLVVHETHHGAYSETLGTNWNSREQELACRSYETLFLLRRLQRERDFLRLEEFDRLMMDSLTRGPLAYGPLDFNRPERWWAVPLGDIGMADAKRVADEVRARFQGEFSDELEYHWYLLHRLAEGPGAYWTSLDSLVSKEYESVDQDWPAHLRMLEREYDRTRSEDVRLHLEADRAFTASQERVDGYRAYFRLEKRRLSQLLQAAATPAQ